MKTNKIIQLLSEKEREKFAFVLKKRKKERLVLLFDYLCACKEEKPDKAALFALLFGQGYEKKKDYLLRNELRLLNARLLKFLSACYVSVVYDWQQDLNVLRLYLQRSAYDLFEETWRRVHAKAEKAQAWAALLDLVRLWADYEQQKSELRAQNFLRLLDLLPAAESYRRAQDAETGAELALFESLSRRYLRVLGAAAEAQAELVPVPKLDSTATAFFEAIGRSHSAGTPQERLAFLMQAQAHHHQLLSIRPQTKPLLVVINNNIGLEYFLLKDFGKAAQYFRLTLAVLEDLPQYARRWDVRFNAYSNMLFAGDYREAINFHRREPDFLAQLPDRLFYRFHYLVAMAYLFDNQHAKSFDLLAQLSLYQRPNKDYYYARLVFACAYAAAADWDNAERELVNLSQTRRKQQKIDAPTAYCATALKNWIFLQLSALSKQEKEAAFLQKAMEIRSTIEKEPSLDCLPLRWLLSRC